MSPEMVENLIPSPVSDMEKVAEAFGFVGRIVMINGRRRARCEAEVRMHLRQPESHNLARQTPMPRRKARRDRIRELRSDAKDRTPELNRHALRGQFFFRPVIGYVGITFKVLKKQGAHDDAINAMKYAWLHRNDKPANGIKVTKRHIEDAQRRLEKMGVAKDVEFLPPPMPNHERRLT